MWFSGRGRPAQNARAIWQYNSSAPEPERATKRTAVMGVVVGAREPLRLAKPKCGCACGGHARWPCDWRLNGRSAPELSPCHASYLGTIAAAICGEHVQRAIAPASGHPSPPPPSPPSRHTCAFEAAAAGGGAPAHGAPPPPLLLPRGYGGGTGTAKPGSMAPGKEPVWPGTGA
eukprot:scaffold8551_cov132-Isochrysis_galbana.AAC.9